MAEFEGDEVVKGDPVIAGDDLYSQVNSCLLSKGLRFSACVWRTGWKTVKGLKTLIACGGVGLLGLYDQFGGADLIQMLKEKCGDNARLGSILIGVAILFTLLRFATSTAVGKAPQSNDEGDTN